MDYVLTVSVPAADEYMRLRQTARLSPKSAEAAKAGLAGTIFTVCVRYDDELVGMGRVVGDGGCFFLIVDVAVHPRHQRRGLGGRIMENLMHQLRRVAPTTAYVSLIADTNSPAPTLYRKFGFEPTAPKSIGMALRL